MKFAVKVHNEFLSRAIQELAFSNGYEWADNDITYNNVTTEYPKGDCVLFFENGSRIAFDNIEYAQSTSDYTLFDAKTDWDKIEQAMKPKEPRVIWVNEFKGGYGNVFTDEGTAREFTDSPTYIRTIKFQEVIE